MFNDLISWSEKEFSQLPWRKKRSLYGTLVSEIMLQQTTVSTVLGKYDEFLAQFPSIKELATATEEQVTIAWKGLGYYRRARNLRKAAIFIHQHHQDNIPLDYQSLFAIPGIGHYTAKAILAIGANQNEIALDANLERVIARIYGIEKEKGPKLIKHIDELFNQGQILKQVEQLGGRAVNEALMDLGRVYCQKSKTDCMICPLNDSCLAYKRQNISRCPTYPAKKQEKHDLKLLRVLVKKEDKLLAYKKPKSLWLAGQWELPTFILESTDSKLAQYPRILKKSWPVKKCFKSSITKYKIENNIVVMNEEEFKLHFKTLEGLKYIKCCDKAENLAGSTIKTLDQMGERDE